MCVVVISSKLHEYSPYCWSYLLSKCMSDHHGQILIRCVQPCSVYFSFGKMPRGQPILQDGADIYNNCLDAGLLRSIIPRMLQHPNFVSLQPGTRQIYESVRNVPYSTRSASWKQLMNRIKSLKNVFRKLHWEDKLLEKTEDTKWGRRTFY